MKNLACLVSIVVFALLCSPDIAKANLIANGDCEVSWTAWTVVQGVSEVGFNADSNLYSVGMYGNFRSGHYCMVFGGGQKPSGGAVYQIVTTTSGQEYTLSFDYGKINTGSGIQSLRVDVSNTSDGLLLLSRSVSDSSSETNLANVFDPYSYRFVASGNSTRISFTDTSPVTHDTDGGLDNIVLTPVPEPSTFALLGMGAIGLLGWAWRKRK